ncbi:MAG: hypothetical protein Fur0044_39940 [Anaerolineae bacterium]|nr:universal stress protein [Anaerolineales bacterium]
MRLLIATSGSPHSEVALRLGAQMARRAGIAPTVLTVISGEPHHCQAAPILAHVRELLAPQGSDIRTKVRLGQPAEEIIREAKEGHYDLVIVGERPDRARPQLLILGRPPAGR